jgi:O-antigen/teichoic acid export membrane protein
LIRILSPADYGLLAMASVFIGLLMLFAEGGVGLAVVQAQTIDETQLRQMFGLVIVVNSTLFIALVGCAPLIAQFFEEPRLMPHSYRSRPGLPVRLDDLCRHTECPARTQSEFPYGIDD